MPSNTIYTPIAREREGLRESLSDLFERNWIHLCYTRCCLVNCCIAVERQKRKRRGARDRREWENERCSCQKAVDAVLPFSLSLSLVGASVFVSGSGTSSAPPYWPQPQHLCLFNLASSSMQAAIFQPPHLTPANPTRTYISVHFLCRWRGRVENLLSWLNLSFSKIVIWLCGKCFHHLNNTLFISVFQCWRSYFETLACQVTSYS